MSTLTGTLVILRPPSGRSTGGPVGRFPVVFNLIETTSNVGPVGDAGAFVKARDVNAANSSGNTANLAIRMISPSRRSSTCVFDAPGQYSAVLTGTAQAIRCPIVPEPSSWPAVRNGAPSRIAPAMAIAAPTDRDPENTEVSHRSLAKTNVDVPKQHITILQRAPTARPRR